MQNLFGDANFLNALMKIATSSTRTRDDACGAGPHSTPPASFWDDLFKINDDHKTFITSIMTMFGIPPDTQECTIRVSETVTDLARHFIDSDGMQGDSGCFAFSNADLSRLMTSYRPLVLMFMSMSRCPEDTQGYIMRVYDTFAELVRNLAGKDQEKKEDEKEEDEEIYSDESEEMSDDSQDDSSDDSDDSSEDADDSDEDDESSSSDDDGDIAHDVSFQRKRKASRSPSLDGRKSAVPAHGSAVQEGFSSNGGVKQRKILRFNV